MKYRITAFLKISLSCVLLYCFCYSISFAATSASCSRTQGGSYVFTGNMTLQRDVSVGTVSQKYGTASGTVYNFSCTGSSDADRDVYFTMTVASAPVAGYTDVYPTNNPGLGVRYNFALNSGTLSFCDIEFDEHIANSTRTWVCHLLKNTSQGFSLGSSLEFIKLNDNVESSALDTIPAVTATYALNNQAGTFDVGTVWTGGGSIIVNVLACALTTPRLTFPIGSIPMSEFGSTVGFTPSETSTQNLGLDCDAGANINVELNGTQSPDVSDASVLALDGTGGIATGLGVQLLYNGVPLEINKNIVMKLTEGGQEMLPIVARYYQTKEVVMPGEANTSATLTLTYQ